MLVSKLLLLSTARKKGNRFWAEEQSAQSAQETSSIFPSTEAVGSAGASEAAVGWVGALGPATAQEASAAESAPEASAVESAQHHLMREVWGTRAYRIRIEGETVHWVDGITSDKNPSMLF